MLEKLKQSHEQNIFTVVLFLWDCLKQKEPPIGSSPSLCADKFHTLE